INGGFLSGAVLLSPLTQFPDAFSFFFDEFAALLDDIMTDYDEGVLIRGDIASSHPNRLAARTPEALHIFCGEGRHDKTLSAGIIARDCYLMLRSATACHHGICSMSLGMISTMLQGLWRKSS